MIVICITTVCQGRVYDTTKRHIVHQEEYYARTWYWYIPGWCQVCAKHTRSVWKMTDGHIFLVTVILRASKSNMRGVEQHKLLHIRYPRPFPTRNTVLISITRLPLPAKYHHRVSRLQLVNVPSRVWIVWLQFGYVYYNSRLQ